MSNGANERQIGGDHYRSSVQHWDIVAINEVGYLEGNASKYLTRWRKKNGLQDLEKTKHYIEKAIELADAGLLTNQSLFIEPGMDLELARFLTENKIPDMESEIIVGLFVWESVDDLRATLPVLEELIKEASSL